MCRRAIYLLTGLCFNSGAVYATQWQQDIQFAGSNPATVPAQALRSNGMSISLRVVPRYGSGDERVLHLSRDSQPHWSPLEPVRFQYARRYVSPVGWIDWGDTASLGFPSMSQCWIALRGPSGEVIGQIQDWPLAYCSSVISDAYGAVATTGFGLIAMSATAQELWRRTGAGYRPVRAIDGSLWTTSTIAGSVGTPIVLQLDGETGLELQRSDALLADAYIRSKHAAAGNNGLRVLLQPTSSTSPITGMLLDQDAQIVRTELVVPADAIAPNSVSGRSGEAACWFANPGVDGVDLYAAVFDDQLQRRWSGLITRLEAGTGSAQRSCDPVLSGSGRLAIVSRDQDEGVLLRLEPDGALLEIRSGPAFADLEGNIVYTDDESLWIASNRHDTSGDITKGTLLRLDPQLLGFALELPLSVQGLRPVLLGIRPAPPQRVNLLVHADQGLALLNVGAEIQTKITHIPLWSTAQLAELEDGWVGMDQQWLLRLNDSGSIDWQVPTPPEMVIGGRLGCTISGTCVMVSLPRNEHRLLWFDQQGQLTTQRELTGQNVIGICRHADTDRLYLHAESGGIQYLHEVGATDLIDPPVVIQPSAGSFRTLTRDLLSVVQTGAGYQAYSAQGLQWTMAQRPGHALRTTMLGDLLEVPVDSQSFAGQAPRLSLIDAAGELHWSNDESLWRTLPLVLPNHSAGNRMLIAGEHSRHTWLGQVSAQGVDRYQVQVIGAQGAVRHSYALDDASGPILAIQTLDSEEAAVVAYSAREQDRPVLRIRRIQHGLFADSFDQVP